jgi:fluoride exporter
MTVAMVLLGGAIGAPLRYLTDVFVQSRHSTSFPVGTLLVNVFGSLVLGVIAGLVGSTTSSWVFALVGTGFCGALTTFSTFSFETVRLAQEGSMIKAAVNAFASVAVALGMCAAGYAIATALL